MKVERATVGELWNMDGKAFPSEALCFIQLGVKALKGSPISGGPLADPTLDSFAISTFYQQSFVAM